MKKSMMSVISGCAVALAIALAGCGGGTTTSGLPYEVRPGKAIEAHLNADLAATHMAARKVVESEMLYTIETDAMDAREGLIKAKTAMGGTVRVEMEKAGERITRIKIQIGSPFGDTAAEADLLARVQRYVEDPTAKPAPTK